MTKYLAGRRQSRAAAQLQEGNRAMGNYATKKVEELAALSLSLGLLLGLGRLWDLVVLG